MHNASAFCGASDLTRTGDLLITSEMHYRLCYTSIETNCICSTNEATAAQLLWYYIRFLRECQPFFLFPKDIEQNNTVLIHIYRLAACSIYCNTIDLNRVNITNTIYTGEDIIINTDFGAWNHSVFVRNLYRIGCTTNAHLLLSLWGRDRNAKFRTAIFYAMIRIRKGTD